MRAATPRLVARGAVLALLAVLATVAYITRDEELGMVAAAEPVPALGTGDLTAAAGARVFFGHQSVGRNILDAVPGVFTAQGATAPPVVRVEAADAGGAVRTVEAAAGRSGGFVAETELGENGKPLQKLADFDRVVRGGLGDRLDVALMKFCYIDVTGDTDVDALFQAYRTTLAGLERDYPKVRFLHVTTPLTQAPTRVQRIKGLLGRPVSTPDNAARERLNALMRAEYGGERLVDLAAVESTRPDGRRVGGELDGRPYYALYEGYASDSGHLNAEGASRAARAVLGAVARAAAAPRG